MAKRQMSLWTEKEKTAFIEAYKVPTSPPLYLMLCPASRAL